MKKEELTTRLKLLEESGTVNTEAVRVTVKAFDRLVQTLDLSADEIEQSQMLFTHLPMALTRVDKKEKLKAPPQELFKEVQTSPFFSEAVAAVSEVEKDWGRPLPQEEKEYLQLHYTTIFTHYLGGDN
ncbi:PRD domain-containing protein [Salipaludibacillus sp. CUR1]|uniref:PRD domain-containing protein n=1 Tax=Salipaludibacillus sp. CUR1 TaxID=2820003 RepID=UPI001E3877D8|nr:PRD domain-containing protein [Salipaludibacillus sp. CUR1]MCE7791731.1 PRD domain-containing protein [Salipaludibacillus sp. CUR1]